MLKQFFSYPISLRHLVMLSRLIAPLFLATLFFPTLVSAQTTLSTDDFVLKITTTAGTETFVFHTQDADYEIDWGNDGIFEETVTTGNATHTFSIAGVHTIRFRNLTDIHINGSPGKEKYTAIEQWGTAVWNADMSGAFWGANNLTMSENAGTPTMSAVTNMFAMFASVSSFNGDISGWNVEVVTNMSFMFSSATAFNRDISGWNTVAVTDMDFMFSGATAFNSDISGWNTVAVTDMDFMFSGATAFNSDLSGWNTVAVTDMSSMFSGATAFNSDISGWNTVAVTDMDFMFSGATAFNSDLSGWNTVAVTDMSSMFSGASSFNGNISSWDTAAVKGMDFMFKGASFFNGNISGWNTVAVTDMAGMFEGATAFNRDLSGWNTASVMNMSSMFQDAASFNGDLSGWNTAAVTDMNGMFTSAFAFNGDLSRWNTAAVTNMNYMFADATSFNGDISGWNVEAVTNMRAMFIGATSFNGDISGWNTVAVTSMRAMFSGATSFNGDISGWNTVAVTNMRAMFTSARSFNGDISGWNTASVTSMQSMFYGARSFNGDLSGWNVEAVTEMRFMFFGVTLSFTNYDALLIGWNAQNLRSGIRFNAGDSKYNSDAAHAARTNMMNPTASGGDGWTIADGGRVNQAPTINDATFGVTESATTGSNVGTVTATDFENNTLTYSITAGNTGNAFAIDQTTGVITVAGVLNRATMPVYLLTVKATDGGTPALSDTATITVNVLSRDDFVLKITTTAGTETFTFHTQDTNYEIDWDNDGTFEVADANGDAMHIFPIAGVHTIRFRKLTDIFINNSTGKEKYTSIEQWGTGTWDADMSGAFWEANNLIGGYTDTPDMSAVTNMKNMFYGARSFNGDMSGWNTASVTSMDSAFEKASSFNGDLSGWNTASVTNMFQMLAETAFNHDISGWNVEAVTEMGFMFFGVTLSFTNYNALLIGWNAQNLQAGVPFSAGRSQYSSNAAHEARANMKAMTTSGGDGWIISDGGRVPPNQAPTINDATFGVAENAMNGVAVGTVTATDPDQTSPNNTLKHSITAGNTGNAFAIETMTGIITVAGVLNRATTPVYSLIVTVEDGGTPALSDTATITVNVLSPEDDFVLKITTTASDEPFVFHTRDTDYEIDWDNNGTFEVTDANGNATHIFPTVGVHTIRFRDLTDIYINDRTGKEKYTSIEQWGTAVWNADMSNAFYGASNLIGGYTDTPDMSAVTNMYNMFNGASSFNGDMSGWNTASVTNMDSAFEKASSFNGDLSGWNTASVTNMNQMLAETAFNRDLSRWNVEAVTNMTDMFFRATLSPANYDALLIGWNAQNLQTGISFNAGLSQYSSNAAHAARENMKASTASGGDGWRISDSGRVNQAPTIADARFNVTASATTGSNVGTIIATDFENSTLTYSITAGNTGDAFAIDSTTGVITVAGALDRATTPVYLLTVKATEGGTTALSDTATVTITVTRLSRDDFVLKITTTADAETFVFHTQDTDYDIDWDNNGTFEVTDANGNATHTFSIAGVHTIRFRNLTDIFISDNPGKEKYTSIEQWGTGVWNADMSRAFFGASNLTASYTDTPDMRTVTNMAIMFNRATAFNGDLSRWNTVSVTSMWRMFFGATAFNGDLSRWNTAAVTNMNYMFADATSFNSDISGWNVEAVTDMRGMFSGASSFNGDLSDWNVEAVTNMMSMFFNANSFNGDLSRWNTASVTEMHEMFYNATAFNGDLSDWNVEAVTNMWAMFFGATSFNSDLSDWNTASVTNMGGMFSGASSFNGDLSDWNVEAVMGMNAMFRGVTLSPTNYDALLIGWNAQTLQTGVTFDAGRSQYNSDAAHAARTNMKASTASGGDGWVISDGGRVNQAPTIADVTFGVAENAATGVVVGTIIATDFENSTLTYSITAGNTGNTFAIDPTTGAITVESALTRSSYSLIVTVTDGGTPALSDTATITITVTRLSRDDFVLKITTTASDETFVFHTQDADYEIDWGNDGTFEVTDANGNATHTFSIAGVHTIRFRNLTDIYINDLPGKEKYTSIEQWGTGVWNADMSRAFFGASNLTASYTDTPDMRAVTNMEIMFKGASFFNGDMSGWNTASVTNMSLMFGSTTAFNGDISGWNVEAVTNMMSMFFNANSFNGDLSRWNTASVTKMHEMFYNATAFNGDLSDWNVEAVTNMDSAFEKATSFNSDLSRWNTAAVTNMRSMFSNADSFNGDLSGWNVEAVTDMSAMFLNVALSLINYDALLIGWNAQNLETGVTFSAGNSQYNSDAAHAARENMMATTTSGGDGWTISDSGRVNQAPTTNDATFGVAENSATGVVVGTVTATDFENSTLTYSITAGNTGNTFAIDPTTGAITVESALTSSSYSLIVTVTDGGTPALSDTATVTITVTRLSRDDFVLKITTTADDKTFVFHTQDTNYEIDWGNDGTFEVTDAVRNATHVFPTAGVHTIRFRNLTDIYINNLSGKEKYTSIEQWGTAVWNADMSGAFRGARNLTANYTDTPNMRAVTRMDFMFTAARSFNGDLSGWNTAAVTNMARMFSSAAAFNGDISRWNVKAVTDMASMFANATSFNGDISRWNVEAVTDMSAMFLNVALSLINYDALLIGWNAQNLETGVTFSAGNSQYNSDAAHAARENMMATTTSGGDGWTISDSGRVNQVPTIADARFNVTASATTGSNVGTIIATDFENSTLTYSITAGNTGDAFAIDPTTGVITVAGALNLATTPVYLLTVKATDGGTPALSATATVTITVTRFSRDDFVLKITTTVDAETFVFHTQDTDYEIDWGNDGTFDETVTSGNATHVFPTAGVHTIRFRNLTDIYINNLSGIEKYTAIEQWGTAVWNADMSNAFRGANNLIGNYMDTPNMSAVTNMRRMFDGATSFNGDLSGWNTASVTDMNSMFADATAFNRDLSGWNTASVTDMNSMFADATAFNRDLSSWNTASVTDMYNMFDGATSFNGDISRWNTAAGTNMNSMFRSAASFNGDLSRWNVEAVRYMDSMFLGVTLSPAHYDALLIGWNAQDLQTGVTFSAGDSQYSSAEAHAARANMMAPTASGGHGWSISDSGRVNQAPTTNDATFGVAENAVIGAAVGTVTATDFENSTLTYSITAGNTGNTFAIDPTTGAITVESALTSSSYSLIVTVTDGGTPALSDTATVTITVNVLSRDDFVLKITTTASDETFVFHTQDTNYEIDWGNDGTFEVTDANGNATHIFSIAGVHTIRFRNLTDIYINNLSGKEKYTSIEQWGTAVWNADMSNAFFGASNLTASYTDTPDMRAVTNMETMFANAISFNGDLSGWNTAAVMNMSYMFLQANAFNQDLSSWNVEAVTNMSNMFSGATAFNGDISGWNTVSVTSMWRMFFGATAFNGDISGWNTASVTNMSNMFSGATAFNRDLSGWNVEAITNMSSMLFGVTLSPTNYDALLIGWNAQDLRTGVFFSAGNSQYNSADAHAARENMKASTASGGDGWVISDGGRANRAPTTNDATFGVAENAATGVVVGTVTATDFENSTLTYSITAGNTGDAFAIDPMTGAITVANSLTSSSYSLIVTVTDGGTPALSATAIITVKVISTRPSSPQALAATPVFATQIDVTWNPPANPSCVSAPCPLAYEVQRSPSVFGTDTTNVVTILDFSDSQATKVDSGYRFSDTTVRVGTEYYYRVRARNVIGTSSFTVLPVAVSTAYPSSITLSVTPRIISKRGGAQTVMITATISAGQPLGESGGDITVVLTETTSMPTSTITYTAGTLPTITIPAGMSSGTVSYEITPDPDSGSDDTIITFGGSASGGNGNVVSIDAADVGTTTVTMVEAGLKVSTSTISIREGETGEFTVSLQSQPSEDVTVTAVSSDTDEARVSPPALIFTPDNWNETQTVTIRTVDNKADDGNGTFTITLTAMTASRQDVYDGVPEETVSGIRLDDEGPQVGTPIGEVTVLVGASVDIDITGAFDGGALGISGLTYEFTADSSGIATATANQSGNAVTMTVTAVSAGKIFMTVVATASDGNQATQTFTVVVVARNPNPGSTVTGTVPFPAGVGGTTTTSVAVTVAATTGMDIPGARIARFADDAMVISHYINGIEPITNAAVIAKAVSAGFDILKDQFVDITVQKQDSTGGSVCGGSVSSRCQVTLSYTEADLLALEVKNVNKDLLIIHYDREKEAWEALDKVDVDTITMTITAYTSSFSPFGLATRGALNKELVTQLNREIMTVFTQNLVASTVASVENRMGAAFSGTPQGAGYQFDGQTVELDAQTTMSNSFQDVLERKLPTYLQSLTDDTLDLQRMLSNSSFVLPLNASAGGSTGNEGSNNLTIWGSSNYSTMSGNKTAAVGRLDWKGNMFGLQLGVDKTLHDGLLVGGLLSWSKGKASFTRDNKGGDYNHTMFSIHPYAARSVDDVEVWSSAGLGRGNLEIEQDGDKGKASTRMLSLSGGFKRQLSESGLNIKSDISLASTKIGKMTVVDFPGGTVNSQRLRLLLESSRERTLESGKRMTPTLEAGLRYDGGDGKKGLGIALGAGVRFASVSGLIMEGKFHTLVGQKNYKEWGVRGELRKPANVNGLGLSFALIPSYGRTADVDQVWQAVPGGSNARDYQMTVKASLGYGLFASGGRGLVSPYIEATMGDNARNYRMGVTWQRGKVFDLQLSGERAESGNGTGQHRVLLESRIRF